MNFTAQKMKFSIEDFFSKCDQTSNLVTFKEILNGKLHFLCSAFNKVSSHGDVFATQSNISDRFFCKNS